MRADDAATLFSLLEKQEAHLFVVDARSLPSGDLRKLLERVESLDAPPYLALFNLSGPPELENGHLAVSGFTIPPTPEQMDNLLDRARLNRSWVERQRGLRTRIEALTRQGHEKDRVIQSREDRYARLEKRFFDSFTLSQIGKTLTAIASLKELSRTFLSMIREVHESRNCALLLHDEARDVFFVQDSLGFPDELAGCRDFSLQGGLFWQLLTAGDPFPVVDAGGGYRFAQLTQRLGIEVLASELWVPLKVRNQMVGILTLGAKGDGQSYTTEEMSFLSQMTVPAAMAFESARANIQRDQATKDLRKKMENLSILYSVSRAMNFMNDLRRVLKLILDKAVDAVGAQKASLMLLDEESSELVVKVVRGVPPEVEAKINAGEIECKKIKVGEGIAGKVAITRKHLLVDDARSSKDFAGADASFVDNILCVPMTAGDDCIGVINVTNKQSGEKFTDDDVDIMLTLAGQAAVTIHNAKLYYLAITDGMTQLHIRRYFEQRLREEVHRARRFKHPVSLILFDLDHFKSVNDTRGHQAGDMVLVTIGRIIRACIREVDIPARYGGEEFAVLCPETSRGASEVVAERLRSAIEEALISTTSGEIKITASFGIASYPENGASEHELIEAADRALYRAKATGRNQVCFSDAEQDGEVLPSPPESSDSAPPRVAASLSDLDRVLAKNGAAGPGPDETGPEPTAGGYLEGIDEPPSLRTR